MYNKKELQAKNRKENIITMIEAHLPNNFGSLEREAQKTEWSKASAKYVADTIHNNRDSNLTEGWEIVVKNDNNYYFNFPPAFPVEKKKFYEQKLAEAKKLFPF